MPDQQAGKIGSRFHLRHGIKQRQAAQPKKLMQQATALPRAIQPARKGARMMRRAAMEASRQNRMGGKRGEDLACHVCGEVKDLPATHAHPFGMAAG